MTESKATAKLAAVIDERDRVAAKLGNIVNDPGYSEKLQREIQLLDAKIVRLMGGEAPRVYDRPQIARPGRIVPLQKRG